MKTKDLLLLAGGGYLLYEVLRPRFPTLLHTMDTSAPTTPTPGVLETEPQQTPVSNAVQANQPITQPAPLQVPTVYTTTAEQVAAAVAAQTGDLASGLQAQALIAQRGAMTALDQMQSMGITQAQVDFIQSILNQRNPATGMYYTYADIEAASGMTESQINAIVNYFQQVNLANVSAAGG